MDTLESISEEYLKWAPVSLTVREVTRINALKLLDQKNQILKLRPVLDVGCGDGKWWRYLLGHDLSGVHGIDISRSEIDQAKATISAQCLDVTGAEFTRELNVKKFELIIGNCSLEHIFEIDKALLNINSVMSEGGTFIMFVPTPYWALKGKSIGFLHSLSPRLSMSFSGFVNGFFQHWHLYSHPIWRSILINTGFKVDSIYGLGNQRSEFLFRLGLPSSFLSFLVKSLTGKYANYFFKFFIPGSLWKWLSQKVSSSIESSLLSPDADDIFEYMIVCKK